MFFILRSDVITLTSSLWVNIPFFCLLQVAFHSEETKRESVLEEITIFQFKKSVRKQSSTLTSTVIVQSLY